MSEGALPVSLQGEQLQPTVSHSPRACAYSAALPGRIAWLKPHCSSHPFCAGSLLRALHPKREMSILQRLCRVCEDPIKEPFASDRTFCGKECYVAYVLTVGDPSQKNVRELASLDSLTQRVRRLVRVCRALLSASVTKAGHAIVRYVL